MPEVVPALVPGERVEAAARGTSHSPSTVRSPAARSSALSLRERLLDRVQVRAVRRQVAGPAPRPPRSPPAPRPACGRSGCPSPPRPPAAAPAPAPARRRPRTGRRSSPRRSPSGRPSRRPAAPPRTWSSSSARAAPASTSRSPRGHRPWRPGHVGARPRLVDEHQLVRVEAPAGSARHAARFAATSGRSCSAARTDFFSASGRAAATARHRVARLTARPSRG